MSSTISASAATASATATRGRDGFGWPKSLLLTNSSEVESMLADIPFIALGLLGIGLATLFIGTRRMNRAILDIFIACAFAFAAGAFNLTNLVSSETRNQPIRGLSIATQVSVALFVTFKLFYIYRKCMQPSMYETPTLIPVVRGKADQRSTVLSYTQPLTMHSRSWANFGMWGGIAQFSIYFLIFNIGIVEGIFRIGFLSNVRLFKEVSRISAALQVFAYTVFIFKFMDGARRVRTKAVRNWMEILPVVTGSLITIAVQIVNLVITGFGESPQGRFLLASAVYIWLLDTAICDMKHPIRDSLDLSRSESYRSTSKRSSMSKDDEVPPPIEHDVVRVDLPTSQENTVKPGPHIRHGSRVPSWLKRQFSLRSKDKSPTSSGQFSDAPHETAERNNGLVYVSKMDEELGARGSFYYHSPSAVQSTFASAYSVPSVLPAVPQSAPAIQFPTPPKRMTQYSMDSQTLPPVPEHSRKGSSSSFGKGVYDSRGARLSSPAIDVVFNTQLMQARQAILQREALEITQDIPESLTPSPDNLRISANPSISTVQSPASIQFSLSNFPKPPGEALGDAINEMLLPSATPTTTQSYRSPRPATIVDVDGENFEFAEPTPPMPSIGAFANHGRDRSVDSSAVVRRKSRTDNSFNITSFFGGSDIGTPTEVEDTSGDNASSLLVTPVSAVIQTGESGQFAQGKLIERERSTSLSSKTKPIPPPKPIQPRPGLPSSPRNLRRQTSNSSSTTASSQTTLSPVNQAEVPRPYDPTKPFERPRAPPRTSKLDDVEEQPIKISNLVEAQNKSNLRSKSVKGVMGKDIKVVR